MPFVEYVALMHEHAALSSGSEVTRLPGQAVPYLKDWHCKLRVGFLSFRPRTNQHIYRLCFITVSVKSLACMNVHCVLSPQHPGALSYDLPAAFRHDWINTFLLCRPGPPDDFRFVYLGPKVHPNKCAALLSRTGLVYRVSYGRPWIL
jgi:hypothetical protein